MAEEIHAERGVCVLMPLWNFIKLRLKFTLNTHLFVSYYKFRSQKLQCWDLKWFCRLKEVSVATSRYYFMAMYWHF